MIMYSHSGAGTKILVTHISLSSSVLSDRSSLQCILGRVGVSTLRPPSVRRWGMGEGEGKTEKTPPPFPTRSPDLTLAYHSPHRWNFLSLYSLPLPEKLKMAAELFTMLALARKNLACPAMSDPARHVLWKGIQSKFEASGLKRATLIIVALIIQISNRISVHLLPFLLRAQAVLRRHIYW